MNPLILGIPVGLETAPPVTKRQFSYFGSSISTKHVKYLGDHFDNVVHPSDLPKETNHAPSNSEKNMRINVLLSLVIVFLFCFESVAEAQGQRGRGNQVSRSALVMADAVQQELDLTEEQQEQLDEMRQAMRSERGQRGQRRRQGNAEGGEGKGKGTGKGKGKRGEGQDSEGKRGKGKRGEGQDSEGKGKRGQGQQRGNRTRGQGQGGAANLERVQKEIDGLSEILLEHQMTRLNEIYVQALGQRVLQDPVISATLEISDDQKTQMQEMRQEMREEMMALRDSVERSEMREKMMEMNEAMNEKMMGLLTKKQKKELAGMKGEAFDLPAGSNRRNRRDRDRTDF
ncbi:MAG: Spy/CpxP family protein refolding chaperone [Pirellulaceae bacterium]|nr:Spy/CpxP family protein refolding chaperone [Pirellulaceae bacterium]